MLKIVKVNNYRPKGMMITVGMGDLKIASSPAILSTFALGSCVAIILYSPTHKVGALIHAMLPEPNGGTDVPGKYVRTSIPYALSELRSKGIRVSNIEAAVIGGANVLRTASNLRIGERNVKEAKKTLREHGVRLITEDTGGRVSRTTYFELSTGTIYVVSPRITITNGLIITK